MRFLRALISIQVGLLTLLSISKSWASLGSSDKAMKVSGVYDDLIQSDNCDSLIKLESKSDLSLSEELVGQILHDILEQISESPIAYCDELKMSQVVEQDPDTTQR